MLPKGWKRVSLGDIAQISSGGTPDRSQPDYWNGDIPWVTTGEIQFNTICNTNEKITRLGLENSSAKIFPQGTLLMAMYGQGKTRGQVAKLKIAASTNQNSAAIQLKEGQDPDFYFHYFAYKYEDIRDLGHSGGISHLNAGILRQIQVPCPSHTEQVEIAHVLSTWEDAIACLTRLLRNSENQLLGLMQTLLSSNFKQEIVSIAIGDLLKTIKRPVKWSDANSYALISVRRRSGGVFHRETLMGADILTKKLNVVDLGDFLISKMQVVHGAMGMVPLELAGMHVSDSYICLRAVDPKRLYLRYFDWLSKTPFIRRIAFRSSYGVHIEKMTFDLDAFLKEKIPVPALSIQTTICEILDKAEDEVRGLQCQLESLKKEKIALMASLFSGTRRVSSQCTSTRSPRQCDSAL